MPVGHGTQRWKDVGHWLQAVCQQVLHQSHAFFFFYRDLISKMIWACGTIHLNGSESVLCSHWILQSATTKSFFYHFVDITVVNAVVLHQHLARAKKGKTPESESSACSGTCRLESTDAPVASNVGCLKHITDDSTAGGQKIMRATWEVPLCFCLNGTVTITGMSRLENINNGVHNVVVYMLHCSKHSNLIVVPEMFPSLGEYIRH